MIILPTPPRRHWVSAFWWTTSVLLTLALAAVAPLTGLPGGPALGAGIGLLVGLAGGLVPSLRWGAYRTWSRVARKVSDAVAEYVTRLLFLIMTVAGPGGSDFLLRAPRPGMTSWTPKAPIRPEDYTSQSDGPGGGGSWGASYLKWGALSGRFWVWSLYPLLALLGLVQTREQGSFGGNVYTLY